MDTKDSLGERCNLSFNTPEYNLPVRLQSLLESFSRFSEAVFSYHCFLVCRSFFFSGEFSSGFVVLCCVLVRGVSFYVFPGSVDGLLQLF